VKRVDSDADIEEDDYSSMPNYKIQDEDERDENVTVPKLEKQ